MATTDCSICEAFGYRACDKCEGLVFDNFRARARPVGLLRLELVLAHPGRAGLRSISFEPAQGASTR